jgi:hypothetical protein
MCVTGLARKILNKPRRRTQLPATTAADGHDVVGRASINIMMLTDDTLPLRPISFVQSSTTTVDWSDVGQVPIDMLPDDVSIDVLSDDALLGIFDFYVHETQGTNRWMTLVHVCQRWRNIILGSPRGLNLQLVCTERTPARRTLNAWPPLPIVIEQYFGSTQDMDNILAALEHNDRIHKITLSCISSAQWENVLPAMQGQFPSLTHLELASSETPPVAIDLISGSAPRLQVLTLDGISLRGLPKFLSSTTDLVVLDLFNIPHSGYISPEAMVTCLSTMTSLKILWLEFESPRSRPDWGRPPPPTRSVLSALTCFWFRGVSEYLEDLVSGIDAPQLGQLSITFFHQLIFDTPQLTQFISRIPTLVLKVRDQLQARLVFSLRDVYVVFPWALGGEFRIGVPCTESNSQLSALAQLCTSSFPQLLIPTVEHLYIVERRYSRPHWQDDIENSQWLEILRPFTAVKDLYLSEELAPRVAPSLQELVEGRVAESLIALRGLHVEESYRKSQLIGARWLSNLPMAIHRWPRPGVTLWSFGIPDVYPDVYPKLMFFGD